MLKMHTGEIRESPEQVSHIGLFHEKANDGRLIKPMGLRLEFLSDGAEVSLSREDVRDVPELEENLSIADRIQGAIKQARHNPLLVEELAEDLQAKPNTIRQALHRDSRFIKLPGNRWGLQHTGWDH